MQIKFTKLVPLVAILAISTLSQGCGDDDSVMAPAAKSSLRVAHLSPDAPAVDVWANGSVVLSNVPFSAFSAYLEVDPGEYRIQVTPTGASQPIVIDATVTLSAGETYTVAAVGNLSGIAPAVLIDDPATSSGEAKIRFVHTSPDAPSVDITLADGTVLFGDVEFAEAGRYLSVAAGSYDLQVRLAGTSTVVLSFEDVALAGNTNYSVFATGLVGDGSLGALVAVDSPGDGSTTVSLTPAL